MRIRLTLLAAVVVALLMQGTVAAVGTVTMSSTSFPGVVRYTIGWTSNASGAVSSNPTPLRGMVRGYIRQIRFVPGSGGTQPSDDYDITIVDTSGVDVIGGAGLDLDNTTGTYVQWASTPFYYDGSTALDLVIANAGNAKTGTVTLWISGAQ